MSTAKERLEWLANDLADMLESGKSAVDDLPEAAVASLRQALCPKSLPGAALLAAYPHVREIELRGATRNSVQMVWLDEESCQWFTFGGDHASIDDALRDAEARAAKAAEKE